MEWIRESAIGALSRMGRVVIPESMPLLSDVDPGVRVAAVRILEGAARHEDRDSTVIDPIVSALKKSLHDPERSVRHQTLVTLGRLHAKDALPDLIEALKDDDFGTRFEVAETITQIDLGVEQVVPVLAEALKDDDKDVRMDAAMTLSRLSDEVSAAVKPVIPQLLQLLQDPDPNLRYEVAATLARFCGPENHDAVSVLIQALARADNMRERWHLAQALEQIGSPEAVKAAKRHKPTQREVQREIEQLMMGKSKAN